MIDDNRLIIWLREVGTFFAKVTRHVGSSLGSRRQQHFDLGAALPNPTRQFEPAHLSWQVYVGQNNLYAEVPVLQRLLRLTRIVGF